MLEIDISAHERYARDQQRIESFQQQYHIPPSASKIIAVQAKVYGFIPLYPAVVSLLQTYQRKTWARFAIPQSYYMQRFISSYVAPSMGSTEKQDADIQKIEAVLREKGGGRGFQEQEEESPEEEEKEESEEDKIFSEGKTLVDLLEKGIKETNLMVNFVISRMNQFIQA